MALLVDSYGGDEAVSMLSHLEHRMRTKQGAMKNGPGYLDVAVSSHLDQLKVRIQVPGCGEQGTGVQDVSRRCCGVEKNTRAIQLPTIKFQI